jgi:hypothetical protein
MNDPKSVAVQYLQAWNEVDPDRRARLLRDGWTADARYVDPLARADGVQQIDAVIAAVHDRFPGFRFTLAGEPDGHGDHVRLAWSLGPAGSEPPIEGSDVIELAQGRIARVVGFLDRVPAAA